jgi:photosystem II stability/assembly factor-like uncharacterized protein
LYAAGAIASSCNPGTPATCFAFKSTDGGASWSCLGVAASRLAIAPSSPSTLYALGFVGADQPLYRTGDAKLGGTWSMPRCPDEGGGIWRSTDGGRGWRKIFATGFFPLVAIDSADPEILYVASEETGVYRTADGGRSWQPLRAGLPPLGSPYNGLVADPRHSGTVYLATSTNGILAYTAP